MKRIGILYSDHVPCTASPAAVERAAKQAGGLATRQICADRMQPRDLSRLDILVNTLGPYFPEHAWPALQAYYERGGVILNVGPEPFTRPYAVRAKTWREQAPTHNALHALSVVDAWAPTGPVGRNLRFELLSPRYRFLAELAQAGKLARMRETCSGYYRLVTRSEPPGSRWGTPLPEAQLERACGWRDAAGRLIAVPITRIDHFEKGSLIFLNFTPATRNYYRSAAGAALLAGMLRTATQPRVRLTAFSELARYDARETPRIGFTLRRLGTGQARAGAYGVTLELHDAETDRRVRRFSMKIRGPGTEKLERTRAVKALPEGFYRVTATLHSGDVVLAESRTGFYKLSRQSIARRLKAFGPITIDPRKSTDYCLQQGRPFAMHGANYFTTDVYRNCFLNLNAYQCDLDLRELSEAGLNILRTGIWQEMHRFFDDAGNIREPSLRSLEAFFLTAARYGMPVQFVLGAFVMNHWNRDQCPIHNPQMRKRNVKAFASFAERFKRWPNVQVDAINEPSYSMAGLWRPARPSGDPYERKNWIAWLKRRYKNDIGALRDAWGVSAEEVPSFQKAGLPDPSQFQRHYDSKSQGYHCYAALADFYAFARESFAGWVDDIRNAVKARDRKMLFMIGRDESLRIPSQQHAAYLGQFDMVNWHQWHRDAVVFSEYFLNRVRGLPCCGQELGVYPYGGTRGLPRLDDQDAADLLERKLLYTFGNWIQWQAHCDPYMIPLSEIGLGLFRADRTERPHLERTRLLAWIEEKTKPLHMGRNEDAIETLVVHPSSFFFSADGGVATGAVHNMIVGLHYYAKTQAHMVLEHDFRADNTKQIGNPKLIILPAAQMVSDAAWQHLSECLRKGKTVLLSGAAGFDEYWRPRARLQALGLALDTEKACNVERVRIGRADYDVSLLNAAGRSLPTTAVDKAVGSGQRGNRVSCHKIGRGKLVLCPVPLELGDNLPAIAALYRFAMREAGIKDRVCRVSAPAQDQSNMLVYPIPYRRCTLYTVVNEGADDTAAFTDLASGTRVTVTVKASRGAKLWLDKKGNLLAAFLNAPAMVGRLKIVPNGDLALYRRGKRWVLLPGKREKSSVVLGRSAVRVPDDRLFREMGTTVE